ncbi:MAG: NitT/TauT family transport system permease protein [Actinomycetota bacterium]|jgi:NitT/TauT family transport system permease protein|nr:NitT/TauT family transport system permease protein [Actinomycetota bacterium]
MADQLARPGTEGGMDGTGGSVPTAGPRAQTPLQATNEPPWVAQSEKVRRAKARRRSLIRGLVSVVVVLAAWEAAVRIFQPSTVIIVGPSAIPAAFWKLAESGELWHHFSVSMRQFLMGYLVAVALAIPLGLWMGASRRAHDYGDPWLTALYATPNVALAPLFVIWLGFGDPAHVAIIALVAFFPVIINTIDGVHAVERDLREVGIAFRANRREAFARIDLPGAMPYIFTGLRLAMARALVGIVVADLFGAQAGLGYLILTSSQLFQTANVFVGVLILAALGVGLTFGLRVLQKKLTPWQTDVKEHQ